MADTLKQMYHGQPSTTTWSDSGTTPAAYDAPSTAIIRHIHISNSNSTTKWVSIVMPGTLTGTPTAATNHFAWQLPIPANSIVDINTNIVMTSSDFIRCLAEATNMTVTISGVEVS